MRKFVINIVSFALLLLLFYGIVLGRYCYAMRNFGFVLPKEKTILVIGDSQTQAAVDDSIIMHVQNVSLAHDGYFTMFRRLQLYVDANPQIDTVIVAFTPHTVRKDKDEFYQNYGYVQESTKHYLPFFTNEDWLVLLRHDPADVISALSTPFKYFWNVSPDYIQEMGYFEVADYSHLAEDIATGAVRLSTGAFGGNDFGNEITLEYLHRIQNFCKSKNLTLIALNTPVCHASDYLDMENYESLRQNEFPDLEVWDYMNLDIPDDCRRDVNHLNRKGADLFSKLLLERLKYNTNDK